MSSVTAIKGFQHKSTNPEHLRDAIVAVHTEKLSLRNASSKCSIPSRIIQTALSALTTLEAKRGAPLKESSHSRQLYRWASNYSSADKNRMKLAYTKEEIDQALFILLTGDAKTSKGATQDFGIPRKTFQ